MDTKKDQRRRELVDLAVRRPSPYEFCVTVEPVRNAGVSASFELTYENKAEVVDPAVAVQSLTLQAD